jgi:hypothetical protein
MKIKPLGNNQTILTIGENEIFFSYGTPVCGFISGQYMVTDKKWSVTTTKHINNYLQGRAAIKKDQAFFDNL